jgi:hypothetical protein
MQQAQSCSHQRFDVKRHAQNKLLGSKLQGQRRLDRRKSSCLSFSQVGNQTVREITRKTVVLLQPTWRGTLKAYLACRYEIYEYMTRLPNVRPFPFCKTPFDDHFVQ